METKVVALPVKAGERISDQLRDLAARIELGDYGTVHSVSWVADVDGGKVEVGFIGQSPLPGAAAHLSLALGMRKLESIE